MINKIPANPIIFAMANPNPEIDYDLAIQTRPDAIVATGRSDFPNQINNVLGFPYIFRGALDVHSKQINDEMKIAATLALSNLAKQPVTENVLQKYELKSLEFGRNYIVPKPLDPRVCAWESTAVAEAAINSGVARKLIDLEAYRNRLDCIFY